MSQRSTAKIEWGALIAILIALCSWSVKLTSDVAVNESSIKEMRGEQAKEEKKLDEAIRLLYEIKGEMKKDQ